MTEPVDKSRCLTEPDDRPFTDAELQAAEIKRRKGLDTSGDIGRLVWKSVGGSFEDHADQIARAENLYRGLNPKDAGEEILCQQIVALSSASTSMLELARLNSAKPQASEHYLKLAMQTSDRCARLQQQLDKRRGLLDQRVVVQQVSVENGGQAMVGHFQGGGTLPAPGPAPDAASHASASATPRPYPPGVRPPSRPGLFMIANDSSTDDDHEVSNQAAPSPRKRRTHKKP